MIPFGVMKIGEGNLIPNSWIDMSRSSGATNMRG
jgi:hypothetical protein